MHKEFWRTEINKIVVTWFRNLGNSVPNVVEIMVIFQKI